MARGTRKPLPVAPRDGHILTKMKEMTTLAGEADSFGIYAMPVPPPLFDTTRHDRWEAEGSRTLLDRLGARVAELRYEPRAFELSAEARAGLDRVLAEVEAHRPGT